MPRQMIVIDLRMHAKEYAEYFWYKYKYTKAEITQNLHNIFWAYKYAKNKKNFYLYRNIFAGQKIKVY